MIRTRKYISWSQFDLWHKSKREYWRKYGLGEDRSQNKYFSKGTELGEALEFGDDGEYSSDELLSVVLKQIPKLDIMEETFTVELENNEPMMVKTDSSSEYGDEFYEYKTGKKPWDQERVDMHDQLRMYALGYWLRSEKKTLPACKLIWIETEETEDGLKYTGVVEEFERTFTEDELLDFEGELIDTINEIEDWNYEELELEDDLVERYIELDAIVKEAKAEMDTIKLEVKVRMEAEEVDYANATAGKFSMSHRKTWKYSPELTKTAADFDKELKKARAQEQKDGVATFTTTPSLRFSVNK